ncbi:MAG: hypothetical protein DLM58_21615 [Pseudonocardiales bacterium]|nr:MAG: hypothetical protein DLM58_21615 [Pseudonocardiales bacterium]
MSAQPPAVAQGMALQPIGSTPSNTAGTASILVAMVLLLIATVGSYIFVHDDRSSSSSTVSSAGGQPAGRKATGARAGGSAPSRATGSYPAPSSATASVVPVLDMGAVKRTMEAYLNAMQNHDLPAARSLVCPRFRGDYQGTYSPEGWAYKGWRTHYQDPVAGTNFSYVIATQNLFDEKTGTAKGSVTHAWQVEHDGGDYFVCGYIS